MTLAILDFEQITSTRANQLWDHIKSGVIDDFNVNNPEFVAARLTAPNTVAFEHPNGIAMLTSILPRLGCELHFSTWGNVSENEIIRFGREVIDYAFETYHLERISATPPAFNKMAIRVSLRLGFRFEGNIRHAFLYRGKYHDVHVYGMLKSEHEVRPRVN